MGRNRLGTGFALLLLSGLFSTYVLTATAYGFQIEPDYSYGHVSTFYSLTNSIQIGGNQFNILPPTQPEGHQIEIFASGSQAGHPVGGTPDTYQPNYDNGYGTGYSAGYPTGLDQGKRRGQSEGTANGQSDGYNVGWNETYQPAFDRAYANALPFGQEAGWKQGIVDGFAKGHDWAEAFAEDYVIWKKNPNNSYWGSGSLTIMGSVGDWFGGNLNWTRTISVLDLSGFYYKLGYDDGSTNGLAVGDTDGYNATYPAAYAAAYPVGYERGTTQGHLDGVQDGKGAGYNAGWQVGYGPGYDGGFVAGIQYYRTGDFSVPNYSNVFGAPMASQIPEPTSFALVGIAVSPLILRRAGRKKR